MIYNTTRTKQYEVSVEFEFTHFLEELADFIGITRDEMFDRIIDNLDIYQGTVYISKGYIELEVVDGSGNRIWIEQHGEFNKFGGPYNPKMGPYNFTVNYKEVKIPDCDDILAAIVDPNLTILTNIIKEAANEN